ncbi:MAG: hypothetical protein E7118_01025 [Bacteroidales bacterium]|nr:hypothetical protein [Bacteroidales bacterium]
MRKTLATLAALLTVILSWGQAQINTKSVKISDFTQKTTKIVLTGNELYDSSLKGDITAVWRISPYEFCTMEEFETLKTDESYYFLLTTKGKAKNEKEASLQFLTLVKGGKDASKGINKMLEIVSFPFAAADSPSGREYVFFQAFLDIIQNYTLDAMEKDTNAYGGLAYYNFDISETDKMGIVFSINDLSEEVNKSVRDMYFDRDMIVVREDDADSFLTDAVEGVLVSYVTAPAEDTEGAYCYKMLIESSSHKLYYFRKHRITKKRGPGFTQDDIRRITAKRKKEAE